MLNLESDRELFTKHSLHMNGKGKQVPSNKTTELMLHHKEKKWVTISLSVGTEYLEDRSLLHL